VLNTETAYFALVVSAVTLASVFMTLRAIKNAQTEILDKVRVMLQEMFEKGHGKPYPTAAAVVTEARLAAVPAEAPEPAPALARTMASATSAAPSLVLAGPGPAPSRTRALGAGGMTENERAAERHHDLLASAEASAAHCAGPKCSGVGGVCACPCASCALRRTLLSRAQRSVGMPVVRMPGESREAWTARSAPQSVPSSGVASIRSESPEALRARLEREEDERDRARDKRLVDAANEAAARAVAAIDSVDVEDVRATVEIPREELLPSEVEPSPGDRESDATHVFDAGTRHTVFGMPSPLAGVPLESPTSSAARTVHAFKMAFPDSTLVSAGNGPLDDLALEGAVALTPTELARVDALAEKQGVSRKLMLARLLARGTGLQSANDTPENRPAALTTPPGGPANDAPREMASVPPPVETPMDPALRVRWHALIAKAQEAGKNAHHCHGERCVLEACKCQCDGCDFIAALLRKARREIGQ
jgi:hypothetical protein